ncbi:allatostatin-A [Scaptodrosophila lebanonensis]|uniref:Allatostatin-A n=1 Tax=Drosophila lebanonensis TaxID=7225 RepID=A0A6J2TM22_DROLE|nr:allatostatin-A [Scaptodrosophila lebanonensis]
MNAMQAKLLLLAVFYLSYVCCTPAYGEGGSGLPATAQGSNSHGNALLVSEGDALEDSNAGGGGGSSNYDKRAERYAFGLGRRAYMYTNGGAGMKRLPVYNFGLGKRSRPYSFGLGKRTEYDYDEGSEYNNAAAFDAPASYMADEKRNRPYSFGLGKRGIDEVDRRTVPNRYGFGLGRR